MVLDKLKLIGGDKGGMYMFDRDLENSAIQSPPAATPTK
jgi:ferritin